MSSPQKQHLKLKGDGPVEEPGLDNLQQSSNEAEWPISWLGEGYTASPISTSEYEDESHHDNGPERQLNQQNAVYAPQIGLRQEDHVLFPGAYGLPAPPSLRVRSDPDVMHPWTHHHALRQHLWTDAPPDDIYRHGPNSFGVPLLPVENQTYGIRYAYENNDSRNQFPVLQYLLARGQEARPPQNDSRYQYDRRLNIMPPTSIYRLGHSTMLHGEKYDGDDEDEGYDEEDESDEYDEGEEELLALIRQKREDLEDEQLLDIKEEAGEEDYHTRLADIMPAEHESLYGCTCGCSESECSSCDPPLCGDTGYDYPEQMGRPKLEAEIGVALPRGQSPLVESRSPDPGTSGMDTLKSAAHGHPYTSRRSSQSMPSPANARSHIPISDLLSGPNTQTSAQNSMPPPARRRKSQLPNRPDTPRPPPELTASNPYDYKLAYDLIWESILSEAASRLNWVYRPTPVCTEGSLPPPFTQRREEGEEGDDDVELQDGDDCLTSNTSQHKSPFPPASQSADVVTFGQSLYPETPPIAPIPKAASPSTKSRQSDRQKPTVQSARVEKKSLSSRPKKADRQQKSRNTSKKATSSVGKLLRRTEKEIKTAAAEGLEGSWAPGRPKKGGRVAAAVEKIERHARDEEGRCLTQNDGTPVRRSQRSNKGKRDFGL